MHIVECDADVVLVSELASIPERRIRHASGKHGVLRRLVFKDTDSVGMIDQDPLRIQPKKFLERFTRTLYSTEDELEILSYTRKRNRLIILYPRLEEWILKASRTAGIDVRRYNLPRNPDQLHEIINLKASRLRMLVQELRENSTRVRALQNYLT